MKKTKEVKLSAEDRGRMIRLYEEITARLTEMALITGRVVDDQIDPNSSIRIGPLSSTTDLRAAQPLAFKGIEWIYKDGECVGTYDHDEGVCRAGC